MLYGIKTRLAAAIFLFPLCFVTHLFPQTPNPENTSLEKPSKKVASLDQSKPDIVNQGIESDIEVETPDVPVDATDFNNLGVRYARRQHYDEAVSALKHSIELDPKFRHAYTNLASVYDLMERPDEALDALRKATQISPFDNKEQAKECELLLLGNHNQESVNCYRNILKTTTLEVVEQVNYGIALMRLEQWPEALDVMEKTTAETQHDARVINAIGMIHYKMGQFKAATEAFKQAVQIDPDQKQVRFNLALAELAARNKPGAISQYKMLSASDPDLAQQLYNIIFADKLIFAQDK